jgi:1-phosphofructokinase
MFRIFREGANVMKIAAVTLNPAIDQTVVVNDFRTSAVNRGQSMQFDAGGKGVNVASFLADYGCEVAVTGFLGRENAVIFEQLFARKRIDDQFVRLPGSTRIGVKIADEANQQTTDINMPGLSPNEVALRELEDTIDRLAGECDWFVLAGKLPPGVPDTLYAGMIARIKQRGRHVALDTSQAALREGTLAGPTVVKPNVEELEQIVGRALGDDAAVEEAARALLENDVQLVVISMGERGALFVDQEKSLVAVPPSVVVKSTVGAGDAMVAGVIAARSQDLDLAGTAKLATAFSLGAITRVGAHLPERDELEGYARQVSVRPFGS